jgi:hypothetical protein
LPFGVSKGRCREDDGTGAHLSGGSGGVPGGHGDIRGHTAAVPDGTLWTFSFSGWDCGRKPNDVATSGVAWRRRGQRPSTRSRWRQQAVAVALVSRGRGSLAGLGRVHVCDRRRGYNTYISAAPCVCLLGRDGSAAQRGRVASRELGRGFRRRAGREPARRASGPSAARTHRKFATGPAGFALRSVYLHKGKSIFWSSNYRKSPLLVP